MPPAHCDIFHRSAEVGPNRLAANDSVLEQTAKLHFVLDLISQNQTFRIKNLPVFSQEPICIQFLTHCLVFAQNL